MNRQRNSGLESHAQNPQDVRDSIARQGINVNDLVLIVSLGKKPRVEAEARVGFVDAMDPERIFLDSTEYGFFSYVDGSEDGIRILNRKGIPYESVLHIEKLKGANEITETLGKVNRDLRKRYYSGSLQK